MSTFQAWPKIPRYNRQVTLTEKIDGTNAAIIIEPDAETWGEANGFDRPEGVVVYHHAGRHLYKILLEGDDLPKGVAA